MHTTNKTNKITISIIIPVYNTSKYLVKCMDSIVNQSFSSFEAIIINDGSTDNSLEICTLYQEKDERIKIFSQANGGISNALNNGISEAQGEWLCFVDSDDWIDTNALEGLAGLTKKFPQASLIRSFCRFAYPDKLQEQTNRAKSAYCFNQSDFIEKDKIGGFTHSLFVKREIVVQNNLKFDTELKIKADMVFNWKCVLNSDFIILSDFVYYNYLIRPDSIIQTLDQNKILDNLKAPELIAAFAKNYQREQISKAVDRYLIRGLNSYLMSCKDYSTNTEFKNFEYRKNLVQYIRKNRISFNKISLKLIIMISLLMINIKILGLANKFLK